MVLQKFTADLTASIPALDIVLDVIDCQVTLDDGRAPYVEAQLTVALPDEETLDLIDPRDNLRILFEAESVWSEPTKPDQTRSFDLRLHEREIDHVAGVVRIRAVSDESLLIDGGLVDDEVDTSAEAFDSSLRAIVNLVLGNFGASLEAGTADADFTITDTTVRTNLMPNPTVRSSIGNFSTNGGSATIARVTGLTGSPAAGVTTYTRTTMSGASTAGAYPRSDDTSPYATVTPGTQYRISVWVRASVNKTINLAVQYYTSSGTLALANAVLNATAVTANTWTRLSGLTTAPATGTRIGPNVYATANYSTGQTFDTLGWMVTEGATLHDYFDGATTDAYYAYAWTGTANASSSTRTRLDNRSPDLLQMEPGSTYWGFLSPLIRTAGLRLWCDESRQWWLTEPGDVVAGTVTVAEGTNAISGADLISLQATTDTGTPVYYTGVVVRYRWTVDGEQLTEYDFSGTGDKVHRVDVNRPYPGPGYAAALLARAAGRGRTQDLTALMDLNASPGMALVSTLPGTPIQVGTVSAVTWRWSADSDQTGTMLVASRGLTDTPPNAWVLAVGPWSAATGTWAGATGTN